MSDHVEKPQLSFVNGANAAFIEGQYQSWLANPESVEPSWRYFFEGYQFASDMGVGANTPGEGGTESTIHVQQSAMVESYITLIRRMGHVNAWLNPLEPKPPMREDMLPERHGLADVDPERMFHPANMLNSEAMSFREIRDLLTETYCESVGADYRDIPSVEEVAWMQNTMESSRNKPAYSPEEKRRILDRLVLAEGFEKFLGDRFLGQKRFSLEGLDSLIPLMHEMAARASDAEVEEINIGMAHRGRLNILANFMGKPYELMLKEFEGSQSITNAIDGDVKYHLGFANYYETPEGRKIRVYLSQNPSHLEAVNPVLMGFSRARQRILQDRERTRVLPVLIHGDAAMIGQGIVAETLNLGGLDSYSTGGTIHVITNNQIGFTTHPFESRSCIYASDIAKLIRAPVLHVNADDPEAVVWAGRMAVAYRQKFHRDFVIDLIGYRRHGHNETDEPGYTQPALYNVIKQHPTVLAAYGKRLVDEGIIQEGELKEKVKTFRASLQECLNRVRAGNFEVLTRVPKELEKSLAFAPFNEADMLKAVKTGVPQKTLRLIADKVNNVPDDFHPHPKIERLFRGRQKMMEGKGAVDWGMGEILAYGSLALEGYHIRLSGQDSRRGTFSHRHAVLKDKETGGHYHILNNMGQDQGWATVINSPLSEQGVLGFEFGYSTASKNALVIWEAQFGDFSNGAQIIIDQFIVASEAKWKVVSGLVLLLPHGHEGMGPEHSSARPERFLQLCGNGNIQVANVTTPAQLFHLLRRQMHRKIRKPLVLFSPKSLLRHPKVISPLAAFAKGGFEEVLDDPGITDPSMINRVVFCSGKIYYELDEVKREHKTDNVALVRIEQLFPFPEEKVKKILDRYTNLQEVLWTQEEPSNMGAWTFVRHRIKRNALRSANFRYSGRQAAGTTAEGSGEVHKKEQARIIYDALGLACPINPEGTGTGHG